MHVILLAIPSTVSAWPADSEDTIMHDQLHVEAVSVGGRKKRAESDVQMGGMPR